MDARSEKPNPFEPPLSARSGLAPWERPALVALLMLAGPLVLGTKVGFGTTAAIVVAFTLNFAIRHLKHSQIERGVPIDVRPYFVLMTIQFVAFLFWLRAGPHNF